MDTIKATVYSCVSNLIVTLIDVNKFASSKRDLSSNKYMYVSFTTPSFLVELK